MCVFVKKFSSLIEVFGWKDIGRMLRLMLEGKGGVVKSIFDIIVQQNTTFRHYVQNNSK